MDRGLGKGRTGIEPKVRQVGFVTPGSEPPGRGPNSPSYQPGPGLLDGPNSPSPVMIPPARLIDTGPKSLPMLVRSPSKKHQVADSMPPGSYNPGDSVLGSSTTPSSKDASSTFDVSESFAGESNVASLGASTVKVVLATHVVQPSDKGGGHEGLVDHSKSLKERTSKAQRRAVQEAQRAAKAASKDAGGENVGHGSVQKEARAARPTVQKKETIEKKSSVSEKKLPEKVQDKEKKKDVPPPRMQFDDEQRVAKAKKRSLVEQTETKNRVELFRHLPQFVHGTQLPSLEAKFFQNDAMHPHPSIYKVGLQYLTGDIVGGNARCVAMLIAFKEMIKDYSTPEGRIFIRDLTAKINSHVSFLNTCRPLAISMGNAIKFLKNRIVKLSAELPEAEAKASLISDVDRFIQEKIVFADKEIVKHAVQKIRDGDVVLTHGLSCVVEMILIHAHELGIRFRVVVVDSRPKLEGKKLLKRLLHKGVSCTYTYINGVSYSMQEVTRVFLGAASVLSNGTVYSRVGTASVAMVAHAFSVPVMICCETYKFHERVQLDSICANELGDPDALVKVLGRTDLNILVGWTSDKNLQLLNLKYDATPSDYVSMVITELGMVPPSSVPVILREYRKEPAL